MNWLPTALSTVALLFTVAVYLSARVLLRSADHEHRRNRGLLQRVVSLEGALDSLTDQHRRLNGRFYALKNQLEAWNEDDVPVHDSDDPRDQPQPAPCGPDGASYDICENWYLAQTEGPQSKAAQCTCAYCVAARERRRATKAALAPRAKQAIIEAAKSMGKGS